MADLALVPPRPALARNRSRVVVADINRPAAEKVAGDIRASGLEARAIVMDVTDVESVSSGLAEIRDSWGTINSVAHAAGVLHFAAAVDTRAKEFEHVIRTNLTGRFFVNTEVAPALIKDRVAGSIVNVTSIHARLSEPRASAYTAAKGGVDVADLCIRVGVTWSQGQLHTTGRNTHTSNRSHLYSRGSQGSRAENSYGAAGGPIGDCLGDCISTFGGCFLHYRDHRRC